MTLRYRHMYNSHRPLRELHFPVLGLRAPKKLRPVVFSSRVSLGLFSLGQLLRLNLQSVEKVPSQYVRISFCPENVGNSSSSPQNEAELSPRSIQSCFPLVQGPSCRKSPAAFFGSNWVKYDYNPRSDRKIRCFSIRWTLVL